MQRLGLYFKLPACQLCWVNQILFYFCPYVCRLSVCLSVCRISAIRTEKLPITGLNNYVLSWTIEVTIKLWWYIWRPWELFSYFFDKNCFENYIGQILLQFYTRNSYRFSLCENFTQGKLRSRLTHNAFLANRSRIYASSLQALSN